MSYQFQEFNISLGSFPFVSTMYILTNNNASIDIMKNKKKIHPVCIVAMSSGNTNVITNWPVG
jgi:hypothetical protein